MLHPGTQFRLSYQPAEAELAYCFAEGAKSYLEAEVPPLRAVQLERAGEETDGEVQLVLQTGRRVGALADTLRLDGEERLLCDGVGVGAVMVSDALRFQILATVDESLSSVEVLGERWPLAGAAED